MSEKKEKKKPKLIPKEYSGMHLALLAANRANKALFGTSAMQAAIMESARIATIVNQSTVGLQAMLKADTMIHRMAMQQARVLKALQVSPVIEMMVKAQAASKRLYELYGRLHQMAQTSVSPSSIVPQLEAIPIRTKNTVGSLLNYIGVLERELREKEAENKELLRILGELKKELKEQYVV